MTKPTEGAHNGATHKFCEERTPAATATTRFATSRRGSAPHKNGDQSAPVPNPNSLIDRRVGTLALSLTGFCELGIETQSTAYYSRELGPGNKSSGGTLSLRQGLAGSRLRLVSAISPASPRFDDQLVAVLPRLRRFARGLSGSAADADDLVQAACERALARQHQFQEGTRFDSWMFRIVQTIWIDQVRSREVRKEDGDVPEERLGSDEPVRRVEARLALDEVRRAVGRLPPDQRAALLLVTVEGLTYKEAAEVAQVPVGTIMSRLARARIALQHHLDARRGARRSTSDAAAQ
jgi:RNA polymerase sigma-70 factor, ECF subfamily